MTRCAVIGLGNAGFLYDYPLSNNTYSHAKAYFELKNTELIAASEIDQKKIKIFQSVYNVPVYNSYLNMMEHEKIDIVSICSPNATHTKILQDLIKYNIKCVFCEKPISNSLDYLEDIFNQYNEKKIPIYVNYFRRWDKKITNIKDNFFNSEKDVLKFIIVKYSKGLIHNGTHYLDLFMKWFNKPIRFENIKFIENYNETDPTLSFDIFFKHNNKPIKVSMNGCAEENYSDEIMFHTNDYIIKILNTREIYFYDNKKKLIKTELTNFNNIIVEVIDSIIREISELSYENLNINAKSSYDCLLLANNIISNFDNIKKNNEN